MSLKIVLLTTLTLIAAASIPGCGDSNSAKLGVEGELCFADDDCRGELICDRGLCRDPDTVSLNNDVNNFNNSVNNQNNDVNNQNNDINNDLNNFNNNVNNDIIEDRLSACKDLCDVIGECFGQFDDDCPEQCFNELERLGDEEFAELYSCFQEASCNQIEQCLGEVPPPGPDPSPVPNPDDRYAYCDELAFYAEDACGGGVYDLALELCNDAAERLDDERFYEIEFCLGADDCSELLECAQDVWSN